MGSTLTTLFGLEECGGEPFEWEDEGFEGTEPTLFFSTGQPSSEEVATDLQNCPRSETSSI